MEEEGEGPSQGDDAKFFPKLIKHTNSPISGMQAVNEINENEWLGTLFYF